MIARRLVIHGRVQGVGFRYATVEAAERLRVSGWVRNLRDGGVEALLQGDADAVLRMIEWCRRGPTGAQVSAVDVEPAEAAPQFSGFSIRH